MRFGLKDLFWSVTLASCGIGILVSCYRMDHLSKAFLIFLPGLLFGAAIGRLFHKTIDGAGVGLFIGVAVILWWTWPAVG